MRGIIRIRGRKGRERMTLETATGTNRLNIDPKAVVTLNGVTVHMDDLEDGDLVELDGKPAVNVVATRAPDHVRPPVERARFSETVHSKRFIDTGKHAPAKHR